MPNASLIVDAGMLVVPPVDGSTNEAHRYVDTLLDLAKLLEEPWIAICMSEDTCQALSLDGLYPLRKQLERLFSRHEIEDADANTVAIVIDRLLSQTPSFETYFRVNEVLNDALSTTPDLLQLCIGDNLKSHLARSLVLIAILRKHCGKGILQNALAVRHAPERIILVRALVHDLDHLRDDFSGILPAPPEYFCGDVLVCNDFHSLLDCIDEGRVLHDTTDDAGVEVAIRIGLHKSRLERGDEPDWDDITGMRLGSSFGPATRRCCRDAGVSTAAAAIRAACDAIDQQNMKDVHALRTGQGGNNPQRRRKHDNAKAWRRDVDDEYHIHYWETDDGTIEFASMAVHNDFTIPE